MTLNCNVTGEDRKRLVKAISEFTGLPSKFLGVPSCAYEVGDCQISRTGSISFNENADIEKIRALARALQENGFSVETPEMETVAEESDILPDTGLQILLPLDGFNPDSLDRLTKLIDSKAALIRKALGADRLTVQMRNEAVCFPWWDTMPTPEEACAYTAFIAALCKMAKEAKRVTATEKEIECGKVLFEDRDLSRIEGIVFSGAANLNPTIVVMVVEDTTIRINAYAKEGLINQHTAQRAVKRITELLESQ